MQLGLAAHSGTSSDSTQCRKIEAMGQKLRDVNGHGPYGPMHGKEWVSSAS